MAKGDAKQRTLQSIFNSIFDPNTNTISIESGGYSYSNQVASSATTSAVIKNTAGILHGININTTQTGNVILYNNSTSAAPTILTIPASQPVGWYQYDLAFTTGLSVLATSAWNITYIYR